MKTYCESQPFEVDKKTLLFSSWVQVGVGSLFIALCAQISIPIQPVPMTLQTFAMFILAISLGGKKAAVASLLYLFEATMGLPVLAGGTINSLWFLGSNVGYLLSFPIAAYVIGTLSHKRGEGVTPVRLAFALFFGQMIIFSLGALFLARFVGIKAAITLGVLPFLAGDALKVLVCSCFSKYANQWSMRLGVDVEL